MKLHTITLLLNTAGLLVYFGWLVFGREHILYSQSGMLFLLPCLPFFFVYFFLFKGVKSEGEHDEDA